MNTQVKPKVDETILMQNNILISIDSSFVARSFGISNMLKTAYHIPAITCSFTNNGRSGVLCQALFKSKGPVSIVFGTVFNVDSKCQPLIGI